MTDKLEQFCAALEDHRVCSIAQNSCYNYWRLKDAAATIRTLRKALEGLAEIPDAACMREETSWEMRDTARATLDELTKGEG